MVSTSPNQNAPSPDGKRYLLCDNDTEAPLHISSATQRPEPPNDIPVPMKQMKPAPEMRKSIMIHSKKMVSADPEKQQPRDKNQVSHGVSDDTRSEASFAVDYSMIQQTFDWAEEQGLFDYEGHSGSVTSTKL